MSSDFWETFGDTSDFVEVECSSNGSLACEVLDNYGIPYVGSAGGSLPNLDIKRIDAIQLIKLSLLEQSAIDGIIYEPIVNEEGSVEFVQIGTGTGLSGGDIYYEIQSGTYSDKCAGVMVTGALPLATRKEVKWLPIWGNSKTIYDTTLIANEHCLSPDFSQQATIVFNNPHLESSYEDGIDNLYEISAANPHDHIMGYAHYVDWPNSKSDTSTSVTYNDTAKIPLPVGANTFGTAFIRRPKVTSETLNNPECYGDGVGIDVDFSLGVRIDIPSDLRYTTLRDEPIDKFQSIADVYVVGLQLDDMRGRPPSLADALDTSEDLDTAECVVRIDNPSKQCFKLTRGAHYVIAYGGLDGEDNVTPYIVFANNSRRLDPLKIESTGPSTFYVSHECAYYKEVGPGPHSGMILPTSPTSGILVKDIFVSAIIETPSIVVNNPDGKSKKALNIANNLEFNVSPLVSTELPRPVAYNGSPIDMTAGILDHDPTTVQSLSDTPFELALDSMNGGGMAITLPFLDEPGCVTLSQALHQHLNSGDGTESTYVCGPNADPRLGGMGPNGGIVNSISYSYQDSNSYTISANCGPVIVGDMAQIEGGPSPLATEDISAVGTVIQDNGNHVYYKVRIDGFGERFAINLSHHILRVKDRVSCVIHNNPVEI